MNIYKVLNTEYNFNNINNKLIDRFFKIIPNGAEVKEIDGTFAKIWENENEVISLAIENLIKIEKEHYNEIVKNLTESFKPIVKFCS